MKLPTNVGKDELRVWESRIMRAYKAREKHELRWQRVREFYRGNYYGSVKYEDRIAINWMLVNIRQMMASLYFQNPTMFFKGNTPLGEAVAPVMEQVLVRERQIMGAQDQEREMLWNALMYGTGILKHGYNAEYDMDEPYADDRALPGYQGSSDIRSGTDEDLNLPQAPVVEHNTAIRYGHPWKKSISPFDFLSDPEARTPDEARWFAHVINRPFVDVIRDSRYDKEARAQVEPTGHSEHGNDPSATTSSWREDEVSRDSSMVTLYEIFDKVTQTVIVWKWGLDRPLLVKPYPFFGQEGPYVFLQFLPDDDDFWGLSYADSFSDQIQVLNKMRTQMMDHLQRWGATRGAFRTGSVNPDDVRKFVTNTNSFVEVMGADRISDALEIFPHVPIAGDAWKLTELFQRDLDEVSGISELAQGSGHGIQTATEASYIQQQSGLRVGDMRFLLERALVKSTRKDVSMLRQFWGPERVVPLVGDDGRVWQMVSLSQDLVAADYEVTIEPGSTERVDKSVRVRQTIDAMAQLVPLMPYLQQMGFTLNVPELVRTYLRNTEVFRNPERIIVQLPPMAPPPMQLEGPQGNDAPATPQEAQAQLPASTPVNNMNQMPWETDPAQIGQMFSQRIFEGGPR
jgi:hypothetical protein